jgi:lysophospholipase L1-like esterase
VEYANLAVRGRLLQQVLDEQLPVALEAQPDLVSLVAGGNDLMRPGADPDRLVAALEEGVVQLRSAGVDVLLATVVDPRHTPILRRARGRRGWRTPRRRRDSRRRGARRAGRPSPGAPPAGPGRRR